METAASRRPECRATGASESGSARGRVAGRGFGERRGWRGRRCECWRRGGPARGVARRGRLARGYLRGVLIGWGVGGGLMREGRGRGMRGYAFGRVLEGEADQIVGGAALHDVGCGPAD